MATNPMQRKARNSFILGVIVTLVLAIGVVALLYMQIDKQKKEIDKINTSMDTSYRLTQDVISGQILTSGMFEKITVPKDAIPSDSTKDINSLLNKYSLSDNEGNSIYTKIDEEDKMVCYYISIDGTEHKIYKINKDTKKEEKAASLLVEEQAYYYLGSNNTDKKNITITSNAVVAKVDLKANTIMSQSLITRANEKVTKDLRTEEYNVIVLPVDLITGDYVDIRLMLPNGNNYIVVSKKQVTIPKTNGLYLDDTIKMNLTEEEIMMISCAIVESYNIEGAKLYANKYTQAGTQEPATVTYCPSYDVVNLIDQNQYIVEEAKNNIINRWNRNTKARKDINNEIEKYGNEDNIKSEMDSSTTSTQEARKQYLQSLNGGY